MPDINEDQMSEGKYSYKNPNDFPDPVLRCEGCKAIVHRKYIHTLGCCTECGNRRFSNVRLLKGEEMEQLKAMNIDPEFLALFEGVELEP
jgi:hypothetical protein